MTESSLVAFGLSGASDFGETQSSLSLESSFPVPVCCAGGGGGRAALVAGSLPLTIGGAFEVGWEVEEDEEEEEEEDEDGCFCWKMCGR